MTTVTKGKSGYKARDLIDFNDQQKLEISTYKSGRGLVTHASVSTHTGDGCFSHCFAFGTGGDYGERILASSVRCTEKSVTEQHAKAMEQLAAILERARAHYQKFPARQAA